MASRDQTNMNPPLSNPLIHLKTLASISQTIDGLLTIGFGPNGRSTLLKTSTGQVLITNVGSSILQCLHIGHPVGRMICDSITRHHGFAGDGSKSFACIIAGIFNHISRSVNESKSCGDVLLYEAQQRIALSSAFHVLRSTILPDLFHKELKTYIRSVDLSEESTSAAREVMIKIVETCLEGKYPEHARSHLARILVEFIYTELSDLSRLSPSVAACIDNFRLLCVEVHTSQPSLTCIMEGIIVQRDFLYLDDKLEKCSTVAFALLRYSVERDGDCGANKSTFSIKDASSLKAALSWKTQHCKLLVDRLIQEDVKLLFARHKLGDVLSGTCSAAGISTVQFVDQEDFDRLAVTFNIDVIDSPSDLFNSDSGSVIGHTSQCKPRIIGQKRFVYIKGPVTNIEFNSHSRQLQRNVLEHQNSYCVCPPKQLIICGMSAGACQQLRLDLHNSLKVLGLLTDSTRTVSFCHDSDAEREGDPCHRAAYLPAGGAFEMIACKVLGRLLKRDQTDVVVNEPMRQCILALREGLISVPLRLLKHSYRSDRASIAAIEQMAATCDRVTGIDGRTGSQLLDDSRILEPLAGKLLVLDHVIELTEQLLRIDSILSVKRLPTSLSATNRSMQNDSSDESDG